MQKQYDQMRDIYYEHDADVKAAAQRIAIIGSAATIGYALLSGDAHLIAQIAWVASIAILIVGGLVTGSKDYRYFGHEHSVRDMTDDDFLKSQLTFYKQTYDAIANVKRIRFAVLRVGSIVLVAALVLTALL